MAEIRTPATLQDDFTSNGTLTLPAGYYILGIVFCEDAAQGVTDLKVGSTDGGEQVVTTFTLAGGGGYVPKAPNAGYQYFGAEQTLYVQASNWNSADITVKLLIQKLS